MRVIRRLAERYVRLMIERPLTQEALTVAGAVACTALVWLTIGRTAGIVFAGVFAALELFGLPGTIVRVRRSRTRQG